MGFEDFSYNYACTINLYTDAQLGACSAIYCFTLSVEELLAVKVSNIVVSTVTDILIWPLGDID